MRTYSVKYILPPLENFDQRETPPKYDDVPNIRNTKLPLPDYMHISIHFNYMKIKTVWNEYGSEHEIPHFRSRFAVPLFVIVTESKIGEGTGVRSSGWC